jgi:hypothetical protein
VQRSYDPALSGLSAHQSQLIDQALHDVESLKWLYEYDPRIPPLSLSVYLFGAETRRRHGIVNWQESLRMADDVVAFLEARNPTGWNRFFLAEYYRANDRDADSEARVWNLYRDLAMEDRQDYGTNFYLALSHELGRNPTVAMVQPAPDGSEVVFARYGLGCWYALNQDPDRAHEQVNALRDVGSVGAVIYAIFVLHLLRDESAAAELLQAFQKSEAWRDRNDSTDFIELRLLDFFRGELTGSQANRASARSQLLRIANESDYPACYGSFALWAIGLRHWARNQSEEAFRCFEQCVAKGQFEFPHHAWSRAILRRADRRPPSLAPGDAPPAAEPVGDTP